PQFPNGKVRESACPSTAGYLTTSPSSADARSQRARFMRGAPCCRCASFEARPARTSGGGKEWGPDWPYGTSKHTVLILRSERSEPRRMHGLISPISFADLHCTQEQ